MSNPFDLEEILPQSTYGFSEGGKVKMRKSNVKSIVGELIQHFYGGGMVQPEYYQEGAEVEDIEKPEIELIDEVSKPSPITAQEGQVPKEPYQMPPRASKPITGGSPGQEDYGENPQTIGSKMFNMYGGGKVSNAYNVPNTDDMSFKDALTSSSDSSMMNRQKFRSVGKKYDRFGDQ